MRRTTALLWATLNVLTKRRYEAIVKAFGDIDAGSKQVGEAFLRSLGVREDALQKVLERLKNFDPGKMERELLKHEVSLLTIDDAAYPKLLKETSDPPLFLYFKGDLSILHQPTVALVGTRRMSMYGRRVVDMIVPELVRAGIVTVSGLALGIDSAVAKETLRAGGRTVAVLGHGPDKIFPPSNRKLAEAILGCGGLVLSEFPLDYPPDTYTFPARNRVIAGTSLATVVVEAPEGSGALLTAQFAVEEGRDVFAVPGQIFDPNYLGCHQAITRGHAQLLAETKDILRGIGIIASDQERPSYVCASPEEARVYGALSTLPQTVDDLLEKVDMEVSRLSTILTTLELNGAVRNIGGGQWVKL